MSNFCVWTVLILETLERICNESWLVTSASFVIKSYVTWTVWYFLWPYRVNFFQWHPTEPQPFVESLRIISIYFLHPACNTCETTQCRRRFSRGTHTTWRLKKMGVVVIHEGLFIPYGSRWYCWWKKSCTSWYGKYPIVYKVLYIPGGCLGFLPSTV